jgi:hypothetical protein
MTAEGVRQGTSSRQPEHVLPGAPVEAQITLLEDFLARHDALDRAERLIIRLERSRARWRERIHSKGATK